VCYILRRWLGADPIAVSARLETRRHHRFSVEDTATVTLRFPEATADVFLTWAADDRSNHAEIRGTAGTLHLEDDTLVLARGGAEERWPCPPALSDGSHHPDRFDPVADQFLGAVRDGTAADNLSEAMLCVAIEAVARESSRRGSALLPVSPPESSPPQAG
jgi:predicted dehydrogenase